MIKKGVPKKDGSGGGKRLNKDRSGCKSIKQTGKGIKIKRSNRS